ARKGEDEGNEEVGKPEDERGGKHIGPVHFGKAGDERDFQHAKSARRMRKKRERKRNHENAEHDEEPGIASSREGEIDDRGRTDDLQRPDQQLAADNGKAGIGDLELADPQRPQDRKSTRLNSSHVKISYAVFCLKK